MQTAYINFSRIVVALVMVVASATAQAELTVLDIATAIAKNSLIDEANNTPGMGRKICEAGGRPSYECASASTIGSGICLSRGRPSYECSSSSTLGQGICLMDGRPSYECSANTSLAQGICLAGGRPSYECSAYAQIGQGVCLATGRASYECSAYVTLAEGLCLAKGQPSYNCSSVSIATALGMEIIDLAWAWDQYQDESRRTQWRCRGRSTGQFAEDGRCAGKPQIDNTWPGMQR